MRSNQDFKAEAKRLLTESGFNPNRSARRVERLSQVLGDNPGSSVSVVVVNDHQRAAGRHLQEAQTKGWVYLGSTTYRHVPQQGRLGHCELVFACVGS